jgi:hypothetical protein
LGPVSTLGFGTSFTSFKTYKTNTGNMRVISCSLVPGKQCDGNNMKKEEQYEDEYICKLDLS